jgi:hypothetical protein
VIIRQQYLKYPRRDRFDYKPYSVKWDWPYFPKAPVVGNFWNVVGTQVDAGEIVHEAMSNTIKLPFVNIFGDQFRVRSYINTEANQAFEVVLAIPSGVPTIEADSAVIDLTQEASETGLSVPGVPTISVGTAVV